MESNNLKNILTNIIAIAAVVIGAANAYFQSLDGGIDYLQLAMAVAVALVGYFTGKDLNKVTKAAK